MLNGKSRLYRLLREDRQSDRMTLACDSCMAGRNFSGAVLFSLDIIDFYSVW